MNYQIADAMRPMVESYPSPNSPRPLPPAGGKGVDAEPILATASDVARMMRISTRTLWRLVSAEQVPEPLRFGGAVRWRVEEIKTWIAAGCPKPNTQNRKPR